MGFAQDIEHIAGETRWRKQTLLFSATLEGDAIQDVAERLLEDPVEVSANPSTRERKKIHQWYYRADDLEHKTALLVHLLKQPEATRSIVFVRKRERVHELANWLREAGINNCYLEGEMVQGKRNEAIKRLTEGRVNVLVATDVAARVSTFLTSATSLTSICRAVAILICTVSDVPRAPVVKAPQFRWWKPMTICCWVK
ncbi:ATP-dependent RNA helicase [Escherichia coli]|uniref:ATP-dependent RNA helicase n=1 Tax=Escherichia coli TaxID=562 RepID=A0A2X1KUS0_ECOLX|nr:ATP-dependent RNA helicase [Escherichia coli]